MSRKIDMLGKTKQVFILAAIMASLMLASTGLAAGPNKAGNSIRSITPMREVGNHASNLNAADYFDLVGILNNVEGNQVTIGDRELILAPGVRTSGVSQWNLVGANLNKAGEVIVFELVSDNPN